VCCRVLQDVNGEYASYVLTEHRDSANVSAIVHEGYGVATVSRIDQIIGLFCRIILFYRSILQKRPIILSIQLNVATP